jgi:hypothetical protein
MPGTVTAGVVIWTLMGRLPTWLVVAAIGILIALAAADALRSIGGGEQGGEPGPTPTRADLQGMLVVADAECSVTALRLPNLTPEEPPRLPDCGGAVWSEDGTVVARCKGVVTEIHNASGALVRELPGCSPAWRADGSIGVLHDGGLVLARGVFRSLTLMTRAELHANLTELVERPESYEFVAFDWIEASGFAAVVRGGRIEDQALVVFTMDRRIRLILTGLGRLVSSVRVSPLGNYLVVTTNTPERGFTVLTLEGERIALPRVPDARAIAWSPDERFVALATRANVVVAPTGSREVAARLPVGADALEWLS